MGEAHSRDTIEIRVHGRGGQGGVTCAKIIAAVHAEMGKSVQTFGDYAGERSGAPVRAFARISDAPITNRNKVNRPDHILVLDPTLLGTDILTGLAPGGILAINTSKPLAAFDGRFGAFRLATVDATEIARRHRIGTRSVVIVNTTMAGAFARLLGLPRSALEATFHHLGLASNLAAAREAYDAVTMRAPQDGDPATLARPPVARATAAGVLPLTEHVAGPSTGLKTGSWRTQEPHHVEHLAPCNAWCPAGNDVVGFVQATATAGVAEAARILGRSTPLAAVCGHVCPAPCMEGCNRREYDGSVHIRGLERWVAEHAPVAQRPERLSESARRIAIVGGGPAGLSAAYTTVRAGHRVTILDGEKSLGGLLRTGIPEFRLPRAVVDREVRAIVDLGVETRLGQSVDWSRVVALAREFDAVILATGLAKPRRLDVPGGRLVGIEQGLDFLRRVNLAGGDRCFGHVVVLGGGNTAIDCARSALRSGARQVTVVYRRTAEEMPAIREEVEEARAEGIDFLLQRQPVGFLGEGCVSAVELAEVIQGEPDSTGRCEPVVTDRVHPFACDRVLVALGQSADRSLVPPGWDLREGRLYDGGIATNVWAAGDFSTGDGTVTHAIGDGRRVAGSALAALGESVDVFRRPDRSTAVPVTDIRLDHFARTAPACERVEHAASRVKSFAPVNYGLDGTLEAHRCFSCGHCTKCDTCLVYCPEGILRRRDGSYEVDYSFCKGCGICVHECPRKAMEMTSL